MGGEWWGVRISALTPGRARTNEQIGGEYQGEALEGRDRPLKEGSAKDGHLWEVVVGIFRRTVDHLSLLFLCIAEPHTH